MLANLLRFLAIILALVSLIHVTQGLAGEALVGANHAIAHSGDPAIDSQNRFYGGAFMLYAALAWFCARDVRRRAPLLRILLASFFFAGCTRFLSVSALGWPPFEVKILWAMELGFPPLLWVWLGRQLKAQP